MSRTEKWCEGDGRQWGGRMCEVTDGKRERKWRGWEDLFLVE